MSTQKSSAKKPTQKGTAVVVKKETAVNLTSAQGEKKDVFKDLMKHLEELEQLKKYYTVLKGKKDNLEVALKVMCDQAPNDPFEEGSKEDFPFEIILQGKTQYNNKEQIFKINQKKTVENFTKYLLKEVTQLLEVFEADILEHSKKIK